jgi:hypothetical protein
MYRPSDRLCLQELRGRGGVVMWCFSLKRGDVMMTVGRSSAPGGLHHSAPLPTGRRSPRQERVGSSHLTAGAGAPVRRLTP